MKRREFLKKSLKLTSLLTLSGFKANGSLIEFPESYVFQEPKIKIEDLKPEEIELDKRMYIYLTIDDGPSSISDEILEKLGNNPVVFYILGEHCKNEKMFDIICKELKKGHVLGNHSYTDHQGRDHYDFRKISFEKAKSEILRNDEVIESAHKQTEVKRTHKLFRYPYGSTTKKSLDFLKKIGYEIQGWDIDTNDWRYDKNYGIDKIMGNCKCSKDGNIVLCHERHITLEKVIPFYLSGDYKLVLPKPNINQN